MCVMNVSRLLPPDALSADRAAKLVRQCYNEIQGATMSIQADDYDSPWKDILERYLADFLAFFFPQAHTAIDWSLGYTFLDKELQAVMRDAELGRRLADKLVQVWRRDGQES